MLRIKSYQKVIWELVVNFSNDYEMDISHLIQGYSFG